MKEIETRFLATPEQLGIIKKWLDKNAKFLGEKTQTEYYLDNPKNSFKFKHKLGYIDAEKYLRVRMTPEGDSVCIKVFEIDRETSKSKNLAEHESKVENGEAVLALFEAAGFTDNTKVAKIRQLFAYKHFEICIDEVEELGSFVEVELKEHDDDTEAGLKKIFGLLREIGLSEIDEQRRGYVSMFWNPGYNFGNLIKL